MHLHQWLAHSSMCKFSPFHLEFCNFSPFSLEVEVIPDFHMVAVKLEHERTGAEHLHLARDDQNNVFRYCQFCCLIFAIVKQQVVVCCTKLPRR